MLDAKRSVAARYDAALKGRDDVRPMPRAAWAESACWLYSVLCGSPAAADALVMSLNALRIEARHFWEALSPQAPYRDVPKLLSGVGTALTGRVVSLPCSSHLTTADQERVIMALGSWRGSALSEVAA
jgi:dTDP-4-amino-4,6-dideoxygalactose transaminase